MTSLIVAGSGLKANLVLASTITTAGSGNWNSTIPNSPWPGGTVPQAGDDVVIASGNMITIPADYAAFAATITINANSSGTQNGLTFAASTSSLALTGAITMSNVPTNSSGELFALDAGTLTGATTLVLVGSATSGRNTIFRISTGTANFSGNITFSGTAAQAKFMFTGAGRLNVGGNFGGGCTLTGSTGTINFNGGIAQTIGVYTTYNNIEINNTSGGVTLTGTTTFGGTLTINSGLFTVGAYTLTVNGATTINSTLTISSTSGTKTFRDITINNGGNLNFTAAESITMNGNLQNDGTLSGTTGTWTFQKAGGGGTIGGSNGLTVAAATFTTAYTNSGTITVTGTLTVTGTTLTNEGTMTANGALSGTGGLTNNATGILNIGNTSAITTLTATSVGNTINYIRAGTQTVKATTYYNLTLGGSGAKTITGVTVKGTLSIQGTATASAAPTYDTDAVLEYAGSSS